MTETPEEKARRIGVPLIPKIAPRPAPNIYPRAVAVCGECGLVISEGSMGYVCPRSNCPTGFGGASC